MDLKDRTKQGKELCYLTEKKARLYTSVELINSTNTQRRITD